MGIAENPGASSYGSAAIRALIFCRSVADFFKSATEGFDKFGVFVGAAVEIPCGFYILIPAGAEFCGVGVFLGHHDKIAGSGSRKEINVGKACNEDQKYSDLWICITHIFRRLYHV